MAFAKIFVGCLSWKTTSDDLRRYFQRFGEVVQANVICESGRSKCYGFVTFRNAESAARALENPNPIIDGRIVNCEHKKNYQPKQKGSSDQAGLLQQYQPTPQYYPPFLWDPTSGQYYYLCYKNPFYSYPTSMSYYQEKTNTMQQNDETDQGNTVVVDNADKITIMDGDDDGDEEKVELCDADEEDGSIKQDLDTTKELDKEAVEEEKEVLEVEEEEEDKP